MQGSICETFQTERNKFCHLHTGEQKLATCQNQSEAAILGFGFDLSEKFRCRTGPNFSSAIHVFEIGFRHGGGGQPASAGAGPAGAGGAQAAGAEGVRTPPGQWKHLQANASSTAHLCCVVRL